MGSYSDEMENLSHDYWRLRDFEYAQPLYDLAFLLEIEAIVRGEKKPKYRTLALWKAALALDGYGTNIDRWLGGQLIDQDLDQVPSSRIKTYLLSIRETGTIPELEAFLQTELHARCLRLRRLRGLGPVQIARTLTGDLPMNDWIRQAARNCNLPEQAILDCFEGHSYGSWQPAHILPPLLRLLHGIEQKTRTPPKWNLQSVLDPFSPITSECYVTHNHSNFSRLRRIMNSVVACQPMFKIDQGDRGFLRIRHSMGWSAGVGSSNDISVGSSATELARRMDPLTDDLTGRMKSDLHLHTSWSDGAASLTGMANSASKNGLSYIAVTDHSRSSKVQRGLTPVEWFRQSNSLVMTKPAIPVLHGIEVDILQDGELDLPKSLLSYADFVVGSVHSNWTGDTKINTKRLISAIESGSIDAIGHPTSAVVGKPGVPDYVRPQATLDWEQVFACCARWRVAVEFNCFPSRFDLPRELLRRAIAAGCWLTFGSDAHSRVHLIHLKFGQRMASELETHNVLNFLSFEEIRCWIRQSREARTGLSPTGKIQFKQCLLFDDDDPAPRFEPFNAHLNPPIGLPKGSCVVGIDLTGSEKPTGVAYLEGNNVEACSLVTDEELITYIQNKRPSIVSIDSPLGLPGGSNQINPQAGIVRVAENDLSSIGISAYPALIDSMKELTLRGIRLKQRIECMNPAPIVIESYPGAAQDILCLPRKQRSLDLLKEGLGELGLTGPGLQSTSHDEIDAITSAVVGRFYESGNYEAMGVPEEAQLIVPTHQLFKFEKPPVICLAGKTAVGKSIVARYLAVYYGFKWCRTRHLVRELLLEHSLSTPGAKTLDRPFGSEKITEADLQEFGGYLLHQLKQAPLQRKLCEAIDLAKAPVVVDAIRDITDVEEAVDSGHPILIWYVDSSEGIIHGRLRERARNNPAKIAQPSPVDKTADSLRKGANLILSNSGTLEELRWKVDDAIFQAIRITGCVSKVT